jgi:molecular chaperone DnaK (HSP70)
MVSFFKPLFD